MGRSILVLRGVVHGAFESFLVREAGDERFARVAGTEDDMRGVEGACGAVAAGYNHGPLLGAIAVVGRRDGSRSPDVELEGGCIYFEPICARSEN